MTPLAVGVQDIEYAIRAYCHVADDLAGDAADTAGADHQRRR